MGIPDCQKLMLYLLKLLAMLMIENDVGVSAVSIYKVKKIDSKYFVYE